MSENKKETKNQDMIEKEMKEKMKQTVEDEKTVSYTHLDVYKRQGV